MKKKPHCRVKRSHAKSILRLPDLEVAMPRLLIAFRAPMPSVAIATQSTNSLTGTAANRDYRSARPWWSGTGCTWNRGT
jgi:hypothetical protein